MKRYLYLFTLLFCGLYAQACLCFPSKVSLDRSRRIGNPVKGLDVDQVPVKGFEVKVTVVTPRHGKRTAEGELLAVGRKHIWVQTGNTRRRIHRSRITGVVLVDVFNETPWAYGGWSAAGTLLCLSHGLAAILTVPIWLGAGVSTTGTAIQSKNMNIDLADLDTLYQFSRYPQGYAYEISPLEPEPEPIAVATPKPVLPEPTIPKPAPPKPPPPEPALPEPEPPKPEPPKPVPVKPAPEPKPVPSTSGAFMSEGKKALWGLGQARESWQAADVDAMMGIASLILPYLDPDSVPAMEIVQVKAVIADRWVDSSDKTHHSIAVLPLEQAGLSPEAATRLWEEVSAKK
jgi:hypothetical protein